LGDAIEVRENNINNKSEQQDVIQQQQQQQGKRNSLLMNMCFCYLFHSLIEFIIEFEVGNIICNHDQ